MPLDPTLEFPLRIAVWNGLLGVGVGVAICALVALVAPRCGRLREKWLRGSGRDTHSDARRLNFLAKSVQDTVVEIDESGIILFVSDNMLDVTGLQPSQLVGRSVAEFPGFLDDSPAGKSLRETSRITEASVLATDQPRTKRFRRSDGSDRFFEYTATTYRNSDGEFRLLACTRDITERIAQDERTRQSEIRLSRAERIANLGSWDYYPDEGRLFWSDQMCGLHGLVPAEGPMDLELVRALHLKEDFRDLVNTVVHGHGSSEANYRIRRFDSGKIRTMRTRVEVKRDKDDRITRLSGASMDVTDQLATEEQLRRGQKHFRALVESNIVGIVFTARDGSVIEANEAFLSLLGYSANELPLIWEDLTAPQLIERDRAAHEELQRTGVALPYEREFLTKTGEPVLMLIASAQVDADTAMIIAVDLSERQRAEAYVSQYQKVLERTIAERTQELMESRDRLIENDRLAAVGTLAAGVAHQINNPIGAILNSAEFAMLCREETGAKTIFEQALQVNLVEAKRCARIGLQKLPFRSSRNPFSLSSVPSKSNKPSSTCFAMQSSRVIRALPSRYRSPPAIRMR
jgi:PAS domain S-box-containing protein